MPQINQNEQPDTPPPSESAFEAWGGASAFVRQYATDPTLKTNPEIQRLHTALIKQASVCSYCGVGCSYAKVHNQAGKEKLVPLSDLGLCVKGETSLLTGDDKVRDQKMTRRGRSSDRIRVPMIRDYNGKWREVSWEQALDRAAWLFLHVREWIGPEGIALYGNGQKTIEAIWMASLYKLVFGVPTIGANSEHCLASAGAAHELNFGNEAAFTWKEFEELELCDVAVLHGTNPLVTFPQAYAKLMRNKNAVKVVIDPVESDTVIDLRNSGTPYLHIRFEQGGDVLFNLAVARVIFENGWEDTQYLAQTVDAKSLQTFRNLCFEDRCHPDVVAKQIALEGQDPAALAETIHTYAALLAKPKEDNTRPKPAIVSSMGINQSTGSYGFSTNLNLLLLTGNVGRKGAGSLRIAGQSNATSELMLGFNGRRMVFNLDVENANHRQELAKVLDIPESYIAKELGTPVAQMADNDHLYCFIFVGTHFTRNMPRLGQWLKRLGRSFNIVIDSFLPEGALEYADVILPAFTNTERTGVIQRGDRTLQLQQQVTTPHPLAWSDEQILARLALAIANRLQDADTSALNQLDPQEVKKAFGRYTDKTGQVDAANVFDHVVDVSRKLNVYNKLEDEHGTPISHTMLQDQAGLGVQWQGDGRYTSAKEKGSVFPKLRHQEHTQAQLVRPPDKFLERLVEHGDEKLRSLITGRGRPGFKPKRYIARYNSGIKTLPITSGDTDRTYWIELHPNYAKQRNLSQGDPVRITSHHGSMIGRVSLNEHVPKEFPFLDFVPGEANRLTDYLDADRFTNQSLMKRTPIRIELLSEEEMALWQCPDKNAFEKVIKNLFTHYRSTYPTEEDTEAFDRGEDGVPDWLPLTSLRKPTNKDEHKRAATIGAIATFCQRYIDDPNYKKEAAHMLHSLQGDIREQFLVVILPVLRKLDFNNLLIPILDNVVGPLPLLNASGDIEYAHLKEAHQSAVFEIKEEVVGVQLFVAIKHALELLYGKNTPVPQDDIAIISGIRIPCAADVPSYFMGISPADMEASRLIHCSQIGSYGLAVIDRKNNRAVKLNIFTGVLPRDKELLRLRKTVIMDKRGAPREEHGRFFDRLTELIVRFVRVDTENFHVTGPFSFPWQEFSTKFAFIPGKWQAFRQFLQRSYPSPDLVHGLVDMAVLDKERDAQLTQSLLAGEGDGQQEVDIESQTYSELVTNTSLTVDEKVRNVIDGYIAPVLENDGGKVDLLNIDADRGEVTVRFLGSCANCPASILSVETIVKPPLLGIPGVHRVVHRTHLRAGDMSNTSVQPIDNPEAILNETP